jgi:hypothetical protein
MRTVVFRAPSGCANKIAPQFQPHRPLTSYLLGLRPMNAPPRGIFSIAPPIGAPFFLFGGIGLPPLRAQLQEMLLAHEGPYSQEALLDHEGPYLQEALLVPLQEALLAYGLPFDQALGCLVFFLAA